MPLESILICCACKRASGGRGPTKDAGGACAWITTNSRKPLPGHLTGQLCIRLSPVLTHRIAAHLNAVGVVNETVEDAVGGGRIADLLVPACDRQLRSQNRRAGLITILAD